ncbi:MAG: zinc ribbon domain-containing protein [Clostridia bacterium]|nr:zinc ribbon domain-containing protein [Clostridia bacterium]
MFCTKCGKELENGAAFCSHCGSAVENAQTAQTDFFQDDFAQPQYEMQYQQAQPQQEESNGMAIAGFVCSFFSPLLGWIFGGIGLSRSAKINGKGKGLSVAAIAVASAMFVLGLVSLA